jgi:hypothetical protein
MSRFSALSCRSLTGGKSGRTVDAECRLRNVLVRCSVCVDSIHYWQGSVSAEEASSYAGEIARDAVSRGVPVSLMARVRPGKVSSCTVPEQPSGNGQLC